MKKILIVAVLLSVMLPLAAADKAGRWFVDVTVSYDQPSGVDTTYAYAAGLTSTNGNRYVIKTETYNTNTPRAWAPSLRFGYEADKWVSWVSFYRFNKVGKSSISEPLGFIYIFNALGVAQDPMFGGDGFALANAAAASQKIHNTQYDWNIGRKFQPMEKWLLTAYTGVKYFKLDCNISAVYGDAYDYNDWGRGSQDQVKLQSRTSGWGLNAGLKSANTFNKWLSVEGGLEFSAVHTTRTNAQSEYVWSTLYSPSMGAIGSWVSNTDGTKIVPVATVYVEGQVKMGAHFYGKVGYKFTAIQNAFSFTKLTNDHPFGGYGYVEQNKDLAMDGMYFTIGFKF